MLSISGYGEPSNKRFKIKLYKNNIYQTAISVKNPMFKVNYCHRSATFVGVISKRPNPKHWVIDLISSLKSPVYPRP